jgi:hypothetical protein
MSDIEDAFEKLSQIFVEIDNKSVKNEKILSKLHFLMEADRGKLTKAAKEVQTDDSSMQSFFAGDLKFKYPSFLSGLINVIFKI